MPFKKPRSRVRKPPQLYYLNPQQSFENGVDARVLNVWKMKQYNQRTPGWHKERNKRITASAAASTVMQSDDSCRSYMEYYKLGDTFKIDPTKSCNYKETQLDFILGKCGLGPKFQGNEYTRWGQKYENIVSNLYSQLYQVDILEFGLIPHPTVDFLAASPDGISTKGVMLEIKCPPCRQVADHPPLHYWQQMQVQLACTDLQFCDYFDAHFVEYISAEDWECDAMTWHQENPDAQHHVFGIMLSYDLDVGEEDVNVSATMVKEENRELMDETEDNDDDNDDDDEDDDDDDDSQEPTDEKRTKHVYPPPNIRTVEVFKQWADENTEMYAQHNKPVTRTYYKLHEYYISRATADPVWFEKNLPSMAAVWEQVKTGRTPEGKAILEQIVKDRENAKADRKAKRKNTNPVASAVEDFAKKISVFVDLDVSRALEPLKSKKSTYIHETCLL